MLMSSDVVNWLGARLRDQRKKALSYFPLVLTLDEAMSLIATPQQRALMDEVMTFVSRDALTGHRIVNFPLKCGSTIADDNIGFDLTLTRSGYIEALHPSHEIAQAVFSQTAPGQNPIKDRVVEHVATLEQVALPWAHAIIALNILNRYADTPEQLAFYAPWVRKLIEPSMGTKNGRDFCFAAVSNTKNHEAQRLLAKIYRGDMPKSFLSFTREERDFLNVGTRAFAQLNMLAEVPQPKIPSDNAQVTLSSSGSPTVSAGPFNCDFFVRLY